MKLLFLFSVCVLLHHGLSGVDKDEVSVSVAEGDSVTIQTGFTKTKQDRIRWYYNDIRIAQITGELCKICRDVQCNERFTDRLLLDNKTGSLTIRNIRTSDAGVYQFKFLSSVCSEEIFIVTVHDLPVKTLSKKEGETVTLYPGVIKTPNDSVMWYFHDIPISENTRDPKTCTDEQCTERFRDTLNLDHQTGSLTITNIRPTDFGEYKLQINSSRFSIIRSFSVTVTGVTGLTDSYFESPALDLQLINQIAACIGVVLLVSVAVIYLLCKKHKPKRKTCLQEPSDFNKNILICVSKINEGLMGVEQHEGSTKKKTLSEERNMTVL